MSPGVESIDPASCTHCPEGMIKAEWGPDENSGVPSPKYESTHSSHTLENNTSTCRKAQLPAPGTSHIHSGAHSDLASPRCFLTPTLGPTRHCPPDSLPGHPLPRGPRDPSPSTHPTFPPSQAPGRFLQTLAPSWPCSGGQPHTPLLPTDILESPLISLEGAA